MIRCFLGTTWRGGTCPRLLCRPGCRARGGRENPVHPSDRVTEIAASESGCTLSCLVLATRPSRATLWFGRSDGLFVSFCFFGVYIVCLCLGDQIGAVLHVLVQWGRKGSSVLNARTRVVSLENVLTLCRRSRESRRSCTPRIAALVLPVISFSASTGCVCGNGWFLHQLGDNPVRKTLVDLVKPTPREKQESRRCGWHLGYR